MFWSCLFCVAACLRVCVSALLQFCSGYFGVGICVVGLCVVVAVWLLDCVAVSRRCSVALSRRCVAKAARRRFTASGGRPSCCSDA